MRIPALANSDQQRASNTYDDTVSARLGTDAESYVTQVTSALRAGRLDLTQLVAEPIENALTGMISASLRNPARRAPVSEAPILCRARAWSLSQLAETGYSMHYVECRFATGHDDWAPPCFLDVEGIELRPLRLGNGDEFFRARGRDLRTQTNWRFELRHVFVPACVFSQAYVSFRAIEPGSIKFLFPQFAGPPWRHHAPILPRFVCAVTGAVYFCECAQPWLESLRDELKSKTSGSVAIATRLDLQDPKYKPDLCHLCFASADRRDDMLKRYGEGVLTDHGIYIQQLAFTRGLTGASARTEVQNMLGVSRWKREAELYAVVRKLYPERRVEREAQPYWLGKMRLDVYVPELALAFEHMGEQHYRPIQHFGGPDSHRRTIERDAAKRKLCAANGVRVVDVSFTEPLTVAWLRRRVGND